MAWHRKQLEIPSDLLARELQPGTLSGVRRAGSAKPFRVAYIKTAAAWRRPFYATLDGSYAANESFARAVVWLSGASPREEYT